MMVEFRPHVCWTAKLTLSFWDVLIRLSLYKPIFISLYLYLTWLIIYFTNKSYPIIINIYLIYTNNKIIYLLIKPVNSKCVTA